MANPTMTLIGSPIVVGSGGVSSVTFSSIPQIYTDLVVKASARSVNTSAGGMDLSLAINGSTTTFSAKWLYGTGSAAGSLSRSDNNITEINSATQTASTFGNLELYFPNYTSSNNKSFSSDAVMENNATAVDSVLSANLWSTTTAISSLSFSATSGNLDQYSTFYLYGISNS